jgi:hypothetical protein
MSKESVEVWDVMLIASTDKAYLIRNVENEEVWVPKSQVEHIEFGRDLKENGKSVKEITRMTMPEWIAEKKGLI